MYYAIHCGRLAVHQKTAYVFGVISEEIKKELAVKDLFPEEKEGEVIFVEETRFVTMLDTLIGENGEYNATLVKLISDELGLAKELTSTKIKNHVEQNKENTYSEFINQIRIHPTDYIHTYIFIGEKGG